MEIITSWMRTLFVPILSVKDREPADGSEMSRWFANRIFLLITAVIFSFGVQVNLNAQNIKGVAPLLQPKGGLAIDGNAYVRVTGDDPDAGDWLFENGTDPEGADPGGVFPPSASDGIAEGIPDTPYPPDFYLYPDQTTFFRDNITNNDPTIFTSSNKINDNPNTYTWGTGSSPNKNEIQNAIAHFSYADPGIQYGNEGDLWIAFAADRQVTNGSSYIDFEILQAPLTLNNDGSVTSEGPDGGRTLLDLLITIEFTNGGGAAKVVVRQWSTNGSGGFIYKIITPVTGTVFGTENDVQTIVPYSIYNQDPINEAGFYQYSINQWAEGAVNISAFFPEDACVNLSTLFVRTRTSGNSAQSELKDFPGKPIDIEIDLTPEAPELTDQAACDVWDDTLTAEGCEGTVTWYAQAEGGTALDTGNTYSPGEITETTSFWASCTIGECEGPRSMVTITIYQSPDFDVSDLEACEDTDTGAQSFDLNDAISNEEEGTLSFYDSEADAIAATGAIGDPTSVSVTLEESPKQFWARLDNDDDGEEDCNTIKSFMVTVYDNPDLMVQDLEDCEDEDTEAQTFDLNDAITDADGGSLSFYESEADALAESGAIGSPESYSADLGTTTLWVRSDNDEDAEEGCFSVASFDITVYDNPDLMVQDLADCEDGVSEAQTFDLNDAVTDADGGSLSFYESEADALAESGAIGSPESYSADLGTTTLWVRSDNDDDGEEGCFSLASFDVTVYDNPDFDVEDLASCQADDTETAEFDLNDAISNEDAGSFSFYNSEADALVPENAISNPTMVSVGQEGDTFWVRLDNDDDGEENCFTIKSFDVSVYDNPDLMVQDLADCEDEATGARTFDLNDGVTDADGGSISFYNSEAEAINASGAIENPMSFSVNIGSDQIWVRSDNESDGDETCFSIESFMINVYDNPDLMVQDLEDCEDGTTGAQTFDLNDGVTDADGGSISFYNSEADAIAASNSIASPLTYSVDLGSETIWVRSDNDNDGEEGCYTIDSFEITVYDNPDLMVQDLSDCEDEDTGAQTFDLNDGVTDADGGTLSFYNSETDAMNQTAAIENPLSFSVAIGSDQIWVRSDSTTDGDEDCYTIASFMIYVYDNPDVTATDPDTICNGESVDLSLYVSADGGSLSYHTTQEDADSGMNALGSSIVSPGVGTTPYYVRSETTNGDDICYGTAVIMVTVEECDQEGCTLGYWKNHTDRWCDAYATCDIYGDIFTNAPSELADLTLLEVLNIQGGGIYNLGRQSVAALLNTCSSEVDFAYTSVDGLISDVNAAFSGGTAGSFGSYLDMLNMAGCPLGGSVATTAPSDSCPSILAVASSEAISGFDVSPVPFRETLNVKYNFTYTSNVNIQIFNINGQMLQNFIFKGVAAGDINNLELGFTVRPSQAYIIKVNTDRESFSKTIISSE
ncbi:putative secreted protein (Por secretion system target) [Christiangramia gaetbulicola]|uniref:Putative secreted protein (Por secretion system target) n=1 Tax=Christiangramia gaetbulicola TaxID=703340 RepID=A0A2T6ADL6_9FLAO|nr:T9SS type A sorting domain-containing protein [Christiangramia gaetbulicola]PTX41914.1 putative secreted protein (Por secretion system target) [Christiangramia gaetbulicola]